MYEKMSETMQIFAAQQTEDKTRRNIRRGIQEERLIMIDCMVFLQEISLEKACEITGITIKEYELGKARMAANIYAHA